MAWSPDSQMLKFLYATASQRYLSVYQPNPPESPPKIYGSLYQIDVSGKNLQLLDGAYTKPKIVWANQEQQSDDHKIEIRNLYELVDQQSGKTHPLIIKGQDDPQQALQAAEQNVIEHPDDSSSYFNRGLVYFSRRQYADAIADFTKTLTLSRQFTEAYYYRGRSYLASGDFKRSEADFNLIGIAPPLDVLRHEAQLLVAFPLNGGQVYVAYASYLGQAPRYVKPIPKISSSPASIAPDSAWQLTHAIGKINFETHQIESLETIKQYSTQSGFDPNFVDIGWQDADTFLFAQSPSYGGQTTLYAYHLQAKQTDTLGVASIGISTYKNFTFSPNSRQLAYFDGESLIVADLLVRQTHKLVMVGRDLSLKTPQAEVVH